MLPSSEPEISTSRLGTNGAREVSDLKISCSSQHALNHFATWAMLLSESVDGLSFDSKWTMGGWYASVSVMVSNRDIFGKEWLRWRLTPIHFCHLHP